MGSSVPVGTLVTCGTWSGQWTVCGALEDLQHVVRFEDGKSHYTAASTLNPILPATPARAELAAEVHAWAMSETPPAGWSDKLKNLVAGWGLALTEHRPSVAAAEPPGPTEMDVVAEYVAAATSRVAYMLSRSDYDLARDDALRLFRVSEAGAANLVAAARAHDLQMREAWTHYALLRDSGRVRVARKGDSVFGRAWVGGGDPPPEGVWLTAVAEDDKLVHLQLDQSVASCWG